MNREEIVAFCADFWQVNPSVIVPDLKLDDQSLPQNTSIRFYLFMAQVEDHFNIRVENVDEIMNFGDLFRVLEKK